MNPEDLDRVGEVLKAAAGDDPLKRWAVMACHSLGILSHKVDGDYATLCRAMIEKAPFDVMAGALAVALVTPKNQN